MIRDEKYVEKEDDPSFEYLPLVVKRYPKGKMS